MINSLVLILEEQSINIVGELICLNKYIDIGVGVLMCLVLLIL